MLLNAELTPLLCLWWTLQEYCPRSLTLAAVLLSTDPFSSAIRFWFLCHVKVHSELLTSQLNVKTSFSKTSDQGLSSFRIGVGGSARMCHKNIFKLRLIFEVSVIKCLPYYFLSTHEIFRGRCSCTTTV